MMSHSQRVIEAVTSHLGHTATSRLRLPADDGIAAEVTGRRY